MTEAEKVGALGADGKVRVGGGAKRVRRNVMHKDNAYIEFRPGEMPRFYSADTGGPHQPMPHEGLALALMGMLAHGPEHVNRVLALHMALLGMIEFAPEVGGMPDPDREGAVVQ